ncbi:conserved exported hypothetical protein [Cupriavidus phytorum]|uniref:DUF6351 domain-containing protein n=3 Tax=Cupriavidus TaxID=106589 RepID=A0A975XLD5_9BURK|nr:DUF6351 family protein [Cupriavidus taiwanensis]PZX34271.1 hypothetical protein C7416_101555 [Cupriavidus alkaliphilus]SOY71812.1 conserved exported hypothetical protein [Cupriavidus taiwanensis]
MKSLRVRLMVFTLTSVSLAGCGGSSDDSPVQVPTAMVVSSRPDMVSGGSAVISVSKPTGAAGDLKVMLGSTDVTSAFKPTSDGRLVGLVSGFAVGENRMLISFGRGQTTLVLRNHDRNGPIISGPHQMPWICETQKFNLRNGTTLGPAQDVFCNAPTNISYIYKSTVTRTFKALPSTASYPDDLATTTTTEGKTVNFIVRVETGTLNRAIYQFSVLHDPQKDAMPSPEAQYQGWNRKLVFVFGGSASAGYRQGYDIGNASDTVAGPLTSEEKKLAAGFAVLGSTLTKFGNNANDVLSAETASMVKEAFIKRFGAPIYTMGWGASGGSMQQHLIANNYPGILDGITPAASFSDLHSIVPNVADCTLLDRAFTSSNLVWTDQQKQEVSGYNTWDTCKQWMGTYTPDWLVARKNEKPLGNYLGAVLDYNQCPLEISSADGYDPIANPSGVRCDLYSGIKNLVGVDSGTGYAARGYDNVGVQYGLKVFKAGHISAEQFVTLNEMVGGFTSDGELQGARSSASPIALNNLYEFGRINSAENLGDIPIIDQRSDPGTSANVHDSIRSLSTRARLMRERGNAKNHVILRFSSAAPPPGSSATPLDGEGYVLQKMDQWLMAMKNDTRVYATAAQRVVANKPGGLTDACFTSEGTQIAETADPNNGGQCGQIMPFYLNPRMVAGGPLTDDVLKCQLVPVNASDYPGLSASQLARLKAVFPTGVCDYGRASVGSKPLKGTWLTYPSAGVAEQLQ